MSEPALPVAVIGAGPAGLAAAAHLLERGLTPLVFEAGSQAATHFASVRHVQLFSPWRYNIDGAARRLLEAAGWDSPDPDGLPTAAALIDDYLAPLAALPRLAPHLKLGHRVVQLGRAGLDKVRTSGRAQRPFLLRTVSADGERDYLASAVIDASGTWSQPNPLGAHGLPARGEAAAAARIVYGMPDVLGSARADYAGRCVLVTGAGHSAAGNLLALARLAEEAPGTRLLWAIRGSSLAKVFGGGAADGLPARGQLGARLRALQEAGRLELHTGFLLEALEEDTHGLRVLGRGMAGEMRVLAGIERIIAANGARPDLDLTRELRLRHDPWLESTEALAPLIDPNEHACGTARPHGHRALAHPEPGFYTVGAKSYGRAPNFLMVTGYEQVRSVVAALAGDLAAADAVQLELPRTGVCSTGPAALAQACCGGPAEDGGGACCALDAAEKAAGADSCAGAPACRPPAAGKAARRSGCCA